jgi:hypothetical protein
VAGVVVDSKNGTAMPGVEVRFQGRRVSTTAQGTFHLCDVAPGAHTIAFVVDEMEMERPLDVLDGRVTECELKIESVSPAAPVRVQ